MSNMTVRSKNVVGLFVDGLDAKLAHLSVHGRKVVLHDLRSATLATRMAEHKPAEAVTTLGLDGSDPFALAGADPSDMKAPNMQTEDNNSVLLDLLGSYPAQKYSLTYSLAEPAIYYHVIDHDFGLKGLKLKNRILEELHKLRAFQPAPDAVDTIRT
ncbi:MAG TPA: hypothetical protein VF889_00975, partial [Bacteroidota bacterium]